MFEMLLKLNTTENRQQELIDRVDKHSQKVNVLWVNLLAMKNVLNPELKAYYITNYADSINSTWIHLQNTWEVTKRVLRMKFNFGNAVHEEIDQIDPIADESTRQWHKYVETVTHRSFDIKLHPIDGNLKKVRFTFTRFVARTYLATNITSGSADGEKKWKVGYCL